MKKLSTMPDVFDNHDLNGGHKYDLRRLVDFYIFPYNFSHYAGNITKARTTSFIALFFQFT